MRFTARRAPVGLCRQRYAEPNEPEPSAEASGGEPDADTPSDESKKQYSYSSDANDPGEAAGAPSRESSAGRIASGGRGSTTAGSRERAEGAGGSRAGARGTPSAGRSIPTVGSNDATDRTSERRA
jgi:hypothetical protein